VFAVLTIASTPTSVYVAGLDPYPALDVGSAITCPPVGRHLSIATSDGAIAFLPPEDGARALHRLRPPQPVRPMQSKKAGVGCADSGEVAGGKPATGRLCQAGLRKCRRASGIPPTPSTNKRRN